jgi:hypothetical protein
MKTKAKLFLCLINKTPRHEDVWGSEDIADVKNNIGTRIRWVVNFTQGDRASNTRWIRGWVRQRISLHAVEKRKNCCHYQGSKSISFAVQPLTHRSTDWIISCWLKYGYAFWIVFILSIRCLYLTPDDLSVCLSVLLRYFAWHTCRSACPCALSLHVKQQGAKAILLDSPYIS